MTLQFLSDGPKRYARACEVGRPAHSAEMVQAIRVKYAEELAAASALKRWRIRRAMRRELRKMQPSKYALWGRC